LNNARNAPSLTRHNCYWELFFILIGVRNEIPTAVLELFVVAFYRVFDFGYSVIADEDHVSTPYSYTVRSSSLFFAFFVFCSLLTLSASSISSYYSSDFFDSFSHYQLPKVDVIRCATDAEAIAFGIATAIIFLAVIVLQSKILSHGKKP
jgi:hypothetical protein